MADVGIVPYLVSLDELRAFAGSKDTAKLQRIESLFKQEIAENGDLYRQAIADGAPSLKQALAAICNGEPMHGGGAQYVYALEILCAHFGGPLRNASVYPVEEQWLLRTIDPVFDAWKLGDVLDFRRLIYGVWPIKLPHAEFPRGGTVEAKDVERALGIMRSGPPPRVDKDTIGVIGDVRGWLEAASGRKAGLVCFYY